MDFGLGIHFAALGFGFHLDGNLDQIADDLFHIAANIADFCKLCGFHLDKGGAGQLCQAPGDFCLTNAGWANHQNVLGQHFFAQLWRQLQATPAVAQRNGNGAFRIALANDEPVQFRDDLPRAEIGHSLPPLLALSAVRLSSVMFSLV